MNINSDIEALKARKKLIDDEISDFYTSTEFKNEVLKSDVLSIEKVLSNQFDTKILKLHHLLSQYEQILEDVEESGSYSPEMDDPDDPYNDRMQLIKRVASTLDDIQDSLKNLKNILFQKDKVFFGNITFKEKLKEYKYYIGKLPVLDQETLVPLVIDWRSPVANIFYRSNGSKQKISFLINNKERDIEITQKQFIETSLGKVLDVYTPESGNKEADRYLLSKIKDKKAGKLQDIVNTIQSEQNEIIRSDRNELSIIQGVAGSGKTTILFHKLAYLFFNYPKQFNQKNCLVVVPNRLFKQYTSDILESLGIQDIQLNTFYEFIQKFLKLSFPYIITKLDEQSKTILANGFLQKLEDLVMKHEQDIVKMSLLLKKIDKERFLTHYNNIKIPFSFEKLNEAYITFETELYREQVYDISIEKIYEFLLQNYSEWKYTLNNEEFNELKKSDFVKNFKNFKTNNKKNIEEDLIDFDNIDIPDSKPQKKYIDLKYIELLALYTLGKKLRSLEGYKYDFIAVDEAQNYKIEQIQILLDFAKKDNLIVAGDLAQRIDEGINSWEQIKGLRGNHQYFELNTSYRISKEIATYLSTISTSKYVPNSIIPRKDSLNIINTGDTKTLVKLLIDLKEEDKLSHIAIITKNLNKSEGIFKSLEEVKELSVYLTRNLLESGILITDVASVKGVEFDTVLIIDANNFTETEKYLAATRTLNRLIILEQFNM